MAAKSSMIDHGAYQVYLTVNAATCLPITEDVTGTIDGGMLKSKYITLTCLYAI